MATTDLPWYSDALFVVIYAVLYSALEIEIEGPAGWAKNLPTVPMLGTKFTGYHLLMNITVIGSVAYAVWPRRGFWHAVFYVAAWFLIEDFMWFVYNPNFGISKYNRKHVTWHGDVWPLGIPLHNYVGVAVMAGAAWMARDTCLCYAALFMVALVSALGLAAPLYRACYAAVRK